MNDNILTTFVLTSTLIAMILISIDSISYARSERVGHIFRTQTMKDIKESSLASRSISLIIALVLLVLWVFMQGLIARVADSFLALSRIDQLIVVAIQITFSITTFLYIVIQGSIEVISIFYDAIKTAQKKAEEHQNPV
ncbi:MAG: hypothetical protein ACPGWR_17315 [Ardenticatenaceae bacterium]